MPVEQWRCENCNHRLGDISRPHGLIARIKCPKCGHMNVIRIDAPPAETKPIAYETR